MRRMWMMCVPNLSRMQRAVSGGGTILLLCGLLFWSGCQERLEGLGGGGMTPVKVTLLTEGVGDADDVAAVDDDAPRITEFGTFRGRVVVVGDFPTLPPVVQQGQTVPDAAVCSANPVPDESVVVGPDGGLANVFIYLRRVPNVEIPDPPEEELVLDQKGCRFIPHASLLRVGQPLRLINSDPVAHNVGISGRIMSFNQTLGGNDQQGLEVRYQRAEALPASIRCDFHGWMRAYQLALDHPWGALTGEDGTFVIEDAPATELEFIVWHEKRGYIDRSFKITVPADGTAEQTFEVNASALQ
jgi:hypothetical protein